MDTEPLLSACFIPIDLSSTTSIKDAAAQVLCETSQISVLMNSAGIMALPKHSSVTTSPGHKVEMQFATNHLGRFPFTSLPFPAPRRAPSPRIVNLTSTAFELMPLSFSDCNFSEGQTYNSWMAYGQSKTANVLFTAA
jgi:NAD(P)-dependent dehydrogenase (short-subunit alcohol dehydrogenase family)